MLAGARSFVGVPCAVAILSVGCGSSQSSNEGGSGGSTHTNGGASSGMSSSGSPSSGGSSSTSGGTQGSSGGAQSANGGATSGGSLGAGGATAAGGTAGKASGGATAAGGTAGKASGGATAAGGTAGKASGGSSSGGKASGGTSSGGSGGSTSTMGITCTPQTWDSAPIGWATQGKGTTGGGNAAPTTVTSLAQLSLAVAGTNAAVVQISGKISGTVKVGSNKTILGMCGAEIDGSLDLTRSTNVIVRNLKVVGFNCTDSPSDCSAGADAVHVESEAQNLWFDHMDISDGSDGNLDVTHGADFVTISWTKFHYSSKRTDPASGADGHRFCNLIGHDDANSAEDTGHLNVTFHHVWWADNVNQRMPRVRFGKVHVFNSLYTASGDSACIEVGVNANIRSENNVFQGVNNAVDSSHANSASIIQSIGNQGSSTNINSPAFTPPYTYSADATSSVSAAVMSGAGPK